MMEADVWRCPWCGEIAEKATKPQPMCESRTCNCGAVGLSAMVADSDEIIDDAIGLFGVTIRETSRGFDDLILSDISRSGVEVRGGALSGGIKGLPTHRWMWFRRTAGNAERPPPVEGGSAATSRDDLKAHAIVTVECQKCRHQWQMEYRRLGTVERCPECANYTVPAVPNGSPLNAGDWEVTFRDFRQLLGEPAYRSTAAPLLEKWFGYKLAGEHDGTLIVNDRAEAIDMLWLHLKIQEDEEKQYALYQTAMSLWR